jgi:hypothetical protein
MILLRAYFRLLIVQLETCYPGSRHRIFPHSPCIKFLSTNQEAPNAVIYATDSKDQKHWLLVKQSALENASCSTFPAVDFTMEKLLLVIKQ